jgi:acyl carrier protein
MEKKAAEKSRLTFVDELKSKIRAFVVENFMFGDGDGLCDDTSFVENGIVDSTGILELVEFLESEFSISIADEELVPENLGSIDVVCGFLERKNAGPLGSLQMS